MSNCKNFVSFRISKVDHDILKELSLKYGMSFSELTRLSIDLFLYVLDDVELKELLLSKFNRLLKGSLGKS